MIDSSVAVDQSVSNFHSDSPIPVIEDKEVVYVPDVEANEFVPREDPPEPPTRNFTLRLNIGVEGEDKKEEDLPQMV
jgi:hypothetical protein